MAPTLFVSDIHLNMARPETTRLFLQFIKACSSKASALYVLGDCFDRYLGDDDHTEPHPQIIDAFAAATAAGLSLSVCHGNHDFLIGVEFEQRTGCTLIADHTVVNIRDTSTLLMHGDTLCTDDQEYQAFRAYSRNPDNQREFLTQSLDERIAQAEEIRRQSHQATQLKADDIMDVNQEAVENAFRNHEVSTLIHGHTHRPAIHEFELDGRAVMRAVLGDWYEQDSVGIWDQDGLSLGVIQNL